MSTLKKISKKRDQNEEKQISDAEHGSRNIPFTTNLNSALISKLFGLPFKAGNIFFLKKTKFLSDVSMSTVYVSPKFLVHSSASI